MSIYKKFAFIILTIALCLTFSSCKTEYVYEDNKRNANPSDGNSGDDVADDDSVGDPADDSDDSDEDDSDDDDSDEGDDDDDDGPPPEPVVKKMRLKVSHPNINNGQETILAEFEYYDDRNLKTMNLKKTGDSNFTDYDNNIAGEYSYTYEASKIIMTLKNSGKFKYIYTDNTKEKLDKVLLSVPPYQDTEMYSFDWNGSNLDDINIAGGAHITNNDGAYDYFINGPLYKKLSKITVESANATHVQFMEDHSTSSAVIINSSIFFNTNTEKIIRSFFSFAPIANQAEHSMTYAYDYEYNSIKPDQISKVVFYFKCDAYSLDFNDDLIYSYDEIGNISSIARGSIMGDASESITYTFEYENIDSKITPNLASSNFYGFMSPYTYRAMKPKDYQWYVIYSGLVYNFLNTPTF